MIDSLTWCLSSVLMTDCESSSECNIWVEREVRDNGLNSVRHPGREISDKAEREDTTTDIKERINGCLKLREGSLYTLDWTIGKNKGGLGCAYVPCES